MHPKFKDIKTRNSVLYMSSFYFSKHSGTDHINLIVSTVHVAEMQPAASCTAVQGHPYLQHIPQGVHALNFRAVLDQLCVP